MRVTLILTTSIRPSVTARPLDALRYRKYNYLNKNNMTTNKNYTAM